MKRVCVVLLVIVSSACGSSSPNAPDPFTDQVSSSVQPGTPSIGFVGFTRQDFTPPRSGSLGLTLTWNTPSVDLDLWVSTTACPDPTTLVGGGCTVLGRSDVSGGTSERVATSATQGQSVRIWVLNYSPVTQSYTLAYDIR